MKNKFILDSLETTDQLPEWIYNLDGLTSPKSQMFLNKVCSKGKFNVLEVGAFCGASSIAMLYNNNINLTVVDNWSSIEILPKDNKIEFKEIINPKERFDANIKPFAERVDIIEGDIFSIETYKSLNGNIYDIIFYDGPHETKNIIQFVLLYKDLLNADGLMIIDDYNFDSVSNAINLIKETNNISITFEKGITTNGESKFDFWNGLYLMKFN